MNHTVPKRNNARNRWNLFFEVLLFIRSLSQSLPNNLKLTLDGGANQQIALVCGEIDITDKLLNCITRIAGASSLRRS